MKASTNKGISWRRLFQIIVIGVAAAFFIAIAVYIMTKPHSLAEAERTAAHWRVECDKAGFALPILEAQTSPPGGAFAEEEYAHALDWMIEACGAAQRAEDDLQQFKRRERREQREHKEHPTPFSP